MNSKMFAMFSMGKEILDAIIQIGHENPAGWDQLETCLEFHSSQVDDVYLGNGLSKLLGVVRAHKGG